MSKELVKHYFWECLWESFWKRLDVSIWIHRLNKVPFYPCVQASSNLLREQKGLRRDNSLSLLELEHPHLPSDVRVPSSQSAGLWGLDEDPSLCPFPTSLLCSQALLNWTIPLSWISCEPIPPINLSLSHTHTHTHTYTRICVSIYAIGSIYLENLE